MTPQEKLAAKIAAAVAQGQDQSKGVTGGGGEYKAPAAGMAWARFTTYVEVGVHEEDKLNQQGQKTGGKVDKEKVLLGFELYGPRWPGRKFEKDGVEVHIPERLTITENLSHHVKANYHKLFLQMSAAAGGNHKHMAELLGKAFLIEIFNKESKGKVYANARGPNGYNVKPPKSHDAISDTYVDIPVPQASSPLKAFIWDVADKDDWDALFIDGEYEEVLNDDGTVKFPAKSKNVLQNKIKSAKNFTSLSFLNEVELPTESETPARIDQGSGVADELDDDIPF